MAKTLFDVLRTLGLELEDVWQGEWEGPLMFKQESDVHGKRHIMLMVSTADHDGVETWLLEHPTHTEDELRGFAAVLFTKLAAEPLPSLDELS